ncbi:MAG: hypothetical protein OEZ22_12850 [Spirochaetia bacterium]|nr:hypothetical protein [Spirochaetia bacterium]
MTHIKKILILACFLSTNLFAADNYMLTMSYGLNYLTPKPEIFPVYDFGMGFYYYSDDWPVGFYGNFSIPLANADPAASVNPYVLDSPDLTKTGTAYETSYYNLGVTKKLNNWFGLYGGIGLKSSTAYEGWDIPDGYSTDVGVIDAIFRNYGGDANGDLPNFYNPNSGKDESGINLNIGAHLMINMTTIEIGYNFFPGSFYFGGGLHIQIGENKNPETEKTKTEQNKKIEEDSPDKEN